MIKNNYKYLKERTFTLYKNLETNEQKIRSIIVNCSTTNKDKKNYYIILIVYLLKIKD